MGIKRFDGRKKEYIFEGNQCAYSPLFGTEDGMEYRMDVTGNIWGGSSKDNLLCYFDVETKKVSVFELAFNINKFALTPNGSIWATSDEGYIANFTLDFLKKDPYQRVDMIKIGGDAVPYPLHPLRIEVGRDGIVWVFAENSGLYRYDGSWKFYSLGSLEDPSAFVIDAQGQIWAGLTNTLLKHDGVKWTEYPIPLEFNRQVFPSRMIVGPDGAVWFVNNSIYLGSKSAYRFDGVEWSHFAEVYPDTSFIEKIIFAPDGAVWLMNYLHWARYKP
jgi:streptogramin lyase